MRKHLVLVVVLAALLAPMGALAAKPKPINGLARPHPINGLRMHADPINGLHHHRAT